MTDIPPSPPHPPVTPQRPPRLPRQMHHRPQKRDYTRAPTAKHTLRATQHIDHKPGKP